jgi:hypothetical protein
MSPHLLYFPNKFVQIIKMPVNRSKPDIRHLIQISQLFQDQISYGGGVNFVVHLSQDGCGIFNFVDEIFDTHLGYGPFFQGPRYPPFNFLPIKGFPPPIPFDHHKLFVFDPFITGKTITAAVTLPPAPYGLAVRQGPGLNDLIIKITAMGAAHGLPQL